MKLENLVNNTKSVVAATVAIPTGLFFYIVEDKSDNITFMERHLSDGQIKGRMIQQLQDYQASRSSPVDYIKGWYHRINDALNPEQELKKYLRLGGVEL